MSNERPPGLPPAPARKLNPKHSSSSLSGEPMPEQSLDEDERELL